MGEVYLCGGVGERRESFCLRCLDLRDRIEPAHDLTLFCFLPVFLLDIEDRLEIDGSIVGKVTSGLISGDEGAVSAFFDSFAEDDELVGLDLGEDSPDVVSWPKKDHFFADLGVEGVDAAAATSESNGRELRRFGNGSVAFASSIKVGSAVRGRASLIFWLGGKSRFSLAGGEDVAPDMIEDIELDTE